VSKPPTFTGDQESLDRRALARFAASLCVTTTQGFMFCWDGCTRELTALDSTGCVAAAFGFDCNNQPIRLGTED
jgi:hypothetical protein